LYLVVYCCCCCCCFYSQQINWRNPEAHERTAVMAASLCGQLHTIRWLVKENNARVNGQDAHGCTALNLACRGGYPKVVRLKKTRTARHHHQYKYE